MKPIKKSTWMPVALFLYTTGMAIFFLPKNKEVSDLDKIVTVGVAYLIIALLYVALRYQEKRRSGNSSGVDKR
ncbi:MAG: hypothetical protein ACRCUJ_01290 [Phocaeicola sp.]